MFTFFELSFHCYVHLLSPTDDIKQDAVLYVHLIGNPDEVGHIRNCMVVHRFNHIAIQHPGSSQHTSGFGHIDPRVHKALDCRDQRRYLGS